MGYTRTEVSCDIERRIITGVIIDDVFCRDVIPMIKTKYFKVDYIRRVFQWVGDYYKKYKKSPGKEIQALFAVESLNLREAEVNLIEVFLQDISDHYEQGDSINSGLLLDQTRDFCKARSLEILTDTIEGYRLQGKFDKAEEAIRDFNKIAKSTSSWVNPLDDQEVKKFFMERDKDRIFCLPGILGDMMGWFEREWFVAVMGPMKRGKSFWAWELAYHALTARLKVVWFSLEMNEKTLKRRIYKRLTAMNEYGGEYAYPVFDCAKNQDGSCKRAERKNRDMVPTVFSQDDKYRVCSYCREYKNIYIPATWWAVQRQKDDFDEKEALRHTRAFSRLYGRNLRIRAYPAFSAGFDDLISDLDNLEYTEGFVPDVILIDYIDILAREIKGDERADANEKWQKGKNLAGVRKALVINANQSNRDSIDRKSIEQKNTGEDIRKLAHVDALFTLNQTKEEKKQGVMRIETLIHRHEESTEKGQVIVLQSLKLGQPFLDSEWEKEVRNE